jgi:mannose-1-phosphate guanylyltransferase
MHAVLFAGGFGQRLWPISRRKSPKQFSALLGGKSFLRIAVERLLPLVPFERIFISTNERFAEVILEQIPEMTRANLILEPERRDLAAAVGFAFFTLHQRGVKGDLYFQWSDNYVGNEEGLLHAISVGLDLVHKEPRQIVFIGQRPRFASENLGWIEQGDLKGYVGDTPYYAFRSWHYRPAPDVCKTMFESGSFIWNTGFFVTSMEFAISTYRRVAPEISKLAEEMASLPPVPASEARRKELYSQMPVQHFDEAFLMRIQPDQAVLLNIELDWSDPGTLYALKETLQTDTEANVKQGPVVDLDCKDSLFVNEEHKPLSVMGLTGVIVVNTSDAILVISKDSVRHLGKLLSELGSQGFEELL